MLQHCNEIATWSTKTICSSDLSVISRHIYTERFKYEGSALLNSFVNLKQVSGSVGTPPVGYNNNNVSLFSIPHIDECVVQRKLSKRCNYQAIAHH